MDYCGVFCFLVTADQASAGNEDAGTRAGGRSDDQNPNRQITQNVVVNIFMADPNTSQSQSSGMASPPSGRSATELDENVAESVRDNDTSNQQTKGTKTDQNYKYHSVSVS